MLCALRKTVFLGAAFLILIQQNALIGQQDVKVNGNDHSQINISVGWHSTLFLDKHSMDDFGKQYESHHNGSDEYLKLTYFKGSFCTRKNFCYTLDYRTYAKAIYAQNLVKGDVLERSYTAVNIGFGKTIYRNKRITLTPTLYFSARLSGMEYILLNYASYLSGRGGASSFKYRRSLGVGSGLSYRHLLYKKLNVGLDLFYIHYFQRSVAYPSPSPPGYEDYVKNYKVNQDVVILGLTLGYLINTNSFKKRTSAM